jgi:hypothetical protein
MHYLTARLGLLIYALLTMVEGAVNLLLYILHLDKAGLVADYSLPFYCWWNDTIVKPFWLKQVRKTDAANFN